MCILLDKDIILADVKMIYHSSISQKSDVKDSKYIFKENKTLLFRLTDRRVSLRIMKQKSRAHTYTITHMHSHTHTCEHIKTTHACKDTYMHASVCSRTHTHTHTHTKCSFVIGGPSLWNHLPDIVKEVGSNSLRGYLKRSYWVNLSKNRLDSEFVTVPLTLFDYL